VPLYGRLADLYGRKMMFFIGTAIFLIGSVLCGFGADKKHHLTAVQIRQTSIERHADRLGQQIDGKYPVMFFIGTAIFLIGSVLCGFAHSMTWLILFRAFQGLGVRWRARAVSRCPPR
jgi:MFS family permease